MNTASGEFSTAARIGRISSAIRGSWLNVSRRAPVWRHPLGQQVGPSLHPIDVIRSICLDECHSSIKLKSLSMDISYLAVVIVVESADPGLILSTILALSLPYINTQEIPMSRFAPFLLSVVLGVPIAVHAGDPGVLRTFKVGGEGRWDYVNLDPVAGRIDRKHVV